MSNVDIDQVLMDAHALGHYCIDQYLNKRAPMPVKNGDLIRTQKELTKNFLNYLLSSPEHLPYSLTHQVLKSEVKTTLHALFSHERLPHSNPSWSANFQSFVSEVSSGALFKCSSEMLDFMASLQSTPISSKKRTP